MTDRQFAGVDDLRALARAALGGRRLVEVDRLPGGSKKGVYRLTLDDDSTAIAYVWSDAENFWSEGPEDEHDRADRADQADQADLADPFAAATGLELFAAAHRRLSDLGVRVPQLALIDRSRATYPADVAVLEDVPGQSLELWLERDPAAVPPILARLADTLAVMQGQVGPRFGKVALVDAGGVSRGGSCEQLVLGRARADLAEAAGRDERIGAVRDRLEDLVHELATEVVPRAEYRLIHGELGPDHVLIDAHGQPLLIDIEGLMFFDVEWEHVFLELRFGEHYRRLWRPGLDPARLRFYRLAMRLSLVAGPLRLLDGDFPDRELMLGIVEWNLQQVLTFLP